MATESQRPKHRDVALPSLNAAVEALNLAEERSSTTPAKGVFGSVTTILTTVRDSMINKVDYVELGLACAEVCTTLDRRLEGKNFDDINNSVRETIDGLTTTVAEIQRKTIKQSKRNVLSRLIHSGSGKGTIATWRSDLNRTLLAFNNEFADVMNTHTLGSDVHRGVLNTHAIVSDIHRNVLKSKDWTDGQHRAVGDTLALRRCTTSQAQNSAPGESPPPPPRICFGRDELIEKIVSFAERLTPVALIGVGGIGKTSIALTVLHDDRIRQRFGDDRRFIHCEQFPASRTHLLRRLSEVIGAGIENPGNLTPLRPFLSSKEMLIVLDNAESILGLQGTSAHEVYDVVEELSHFSNVCLCITSRISTVPPDCETLDIPTLSIEAAHDTFYRIYRHGEYSDLASNILGQLDFHPLSITLLATVAQHNKWDTDRLTREWERHRTGMLHTHHSKSLAATIELSLASPTFQELGPDARALLGVVAFFPQGVDENNLNWLFPTIPDIANIFDTFCVLSLTSRSSGFVTMLAPLRDNLCPRDLTASSLLCATKDHYFRRLSVDISPGKPGYEETRWITLEDTNVEHLLDIFTSIDTESVDVWEACTNFMDHLYWHKPRLVGLGSKVEGLLDGHPSKPRCLRQLSRLLGLTGNNVECKRLLSHALGIWRERGDVRQIARTLERLSDANRMLCLYKEGIQRAKEALAGFEQLGDIVEQGECLNTLAWLLCRDGQLDAAEEAASRAINLLPEGNQHLIYRCHHGLGGIYCSKGEIEKSIHHFEVAITIASSFGWRNELFWNHHNLARLFSDQGRFGDANVHIEHVKSLPINNPYNLGRMMELQAKSWYQQRRFEQAEAEALRAVVEFEKLEAVQDLERCIELLGMIDSERE